MIFSVEINEQIYKIDAENPIDISIPLDFYGAQPNAYGVERANSTACEAGEIVGDTRRGGSCNFEQVKFVPHCNGTHTESIGHITHERISVHDCLKDTFSLANLISVEPEKASETDEIYSIQPQKEDSLITKKSIEQALLKIERKNPKSEIRNPKSLVVRTLPNNENKLSKTYSDEIPPFFSTEAMRFLSELKINHLLVDLPSIDRIYDEGKLSNHRIFWNVEAGEFSASEKSLTGNTITELIYVSDEIADGIYLLNLQIAPFAADASPSRPRLFKLI